MNRRENLNVNWIRDIITEKWQLARDDGDGDDDDDDDVQKMVCARDGQTLLSVPDRSRPIEEEWPKG